MEDLLVIIIKLIIRWINSGSDDAPARRPGAASPIPVLPPSELGKPPTPEQLRRRKAIADAKSKLGQAMLPSSAMAKPPTPARLERRKAIAAAKGKQLRGSGSVWQAAAPAQRTPVAEPAPQRPVVEAAQVLHPETLGTQIAEALKSRKNLATALMMTELILPPAALRRAGSN